MGIFLGWLLSALVVAGVAFGVVAVVTGRAPAMADMPPDAAPGLAPEGRVSPEDISAVRLDLAFRGYRMDQVDTLLDQLTAQLAARDEEIAMLRTRIITPRPQGGQQHA